MATEPTLAVLEASAVQDRRLARSTAWFDYWEPTKPEINFLIAITAAAGFWMGSPAALPHFPWMPCPGIIARIPTQSCDRGRSALIRSTSVILASLSDLALEFLGQTPLRCRLRALRIRDFLSVGRNGSGAQG